MEKIPIPSYPGYYADTNGNIYSKIAKEIIRDKLGKIITYNKVDGSNFKQIKPIIFTQKSGRARSLHVNIRTNKCLISVHRLIALTFIENPLNHPYVCHNDGNPLNNCVSNLRWDTAKNNQLDRVKHGTAGRKLNIEKVKEIRSLLGAGKLSTKEIAIIYGVSPCHIIYIKNKKTWKTI